MTSKPARAPSPNGPRLKLERAARHIAELRIAVEQFLASEPFALNATEAPNGDLVFHAVMNRHVPAEWSAIVGDAVHNLRAALDHLAWRMVEQAGGKPSRDTCFPITTSPAANFNTILLKSLSGAAPVAMRFVKRMRPFAGGNTVLARIHSLDVIDKHRLVLVVGAANKQLIIKFKMAIPWSDEIAEFPPIALTPADRQFPIQGGEEVFRICKAARVDSHQPEHAIVFELAFGDEGDAGGYPLIETLEAMHAHVERIVNIACKHLV